MKGRRPKPTRLKIIQGNPGGRKLPENEPQPTGELGDPPNHLMLDEKHVWYDVADVAGDWLTSADRLQVEMLARLTVEARSGFKQMMTTRLSLLVKICGALGLSPTDRTRITAPKKEQADPSERFFGAS